MISVRNGVALILVSVLGLFAASVGATEVRNGTVPIDRLINLNHPGRLVLYFIFDVSGSIGKENFLKSVEFAKTIVEKVGISENGHRAGALTFSPGAGTTKFLPFQYNTTEEVMNALDQVGHTGGGISSESTLTLVREEVIPLTQAVLGKRGQKSIIFILTDGRTNMGGDLELEADKLKNDGVEIFCIGITGDVRKDFLYKIASASAEQHVFILQDNATLSWPIQEITNGTEATCGGELIMENGVLTSPNYPQPFPPFSNCTWRITVPENSRVAFKFAWYNIGQNNSCDSNYIKIFDGHKTTGRSLASYCWYTYNYNAVFSSGNGMTVKFLASNQTDLKAPIGFEAFFNKATCGGDLIMDRGVLSTPNYPRKYPPNLNCIWRITVPVNYQVVLNFQTSFIRKSRNCADDYLEIRDGHESNSTLFGIYCGAVTTEIMASSNKMTVKFVSDGILESSGFAADFKKVGPLCTKEQQPQVNEELLEYAGYKESLEYAEYKESLDKLTQYFLNIRQSAHLINKWGQHLPRVAMALYLSNQDFFHPTNHTGQEIAYEITIQLLSKLSLKKKMRTHELSMYVNALLVSCIDPRDFFGINVLAELRRRADSSNYTSPFTILALCNARDDGMTTNDVSKVLSAFDTQHRRLWTGTDNQAFATMALACLSTLPNMAVNKDDLNRMITDLKMKQHKNGTVDNLTSTALVVQALLATNSSRNDFDMKEAMKFISENVRNESLSIIDSFYILPILTGKSLLNISNDHCPAPFKTDPDVLTDLQILEKRILVQFSVLVGDEVDFTRTWKIKVPANYTLYNVLEKIASLEPEYRVRYSIIDGKPYVSALTKMVDHAEKEMYWFVYKQPVESSEEPKLIESSPVDIQVNENEEWMLWYRSGSWVAK